MRHIREILRCHFDHNLSREAISRSVGVAKGSVTNVLTRFQTSGLTWLLTADVTDNELELRLYPPVEAGDPTPRPDIQYITKELRRSHVTLDLLWCEYHAQYPDSMSRASFYRYCKTHSPVEPTMAMVHKAGDKLFVDYSGDGLSYVNQHTGEVIDVELFVSCLGASGYCYVEATLSQRAEDFVSSHARAFSYFGGVTAAIVPDNLKSGVKQSNRYEPTIAPLYLKLAEHYGCVVLPARVRKPQDKAKVENAVLNIQRYVLGRLRNQRFFSLSEINVAIRELLDQFNNEPMKSYGGQSRRDRFLQIDQPALRQLPAERFVITAIQVDLRVARNYHIQYDKHYYSVPFALAQLKVDVHLAGGIVEIYHHGEHVARHKKQPPNYGYSTTDEHMPPNHRFVKGWSPEYFIGKGTLIGHHTTEVIRQIILRYKHPEQAYKSCLGLLNLDKQYNSERLEAAAARAIYFKMPNYRTVKDILLQGLDQQPLPDATTPDHAALPFTHENVRGAEYYNEGKK
jgi:transposase